MATTNLDSAEHAGDREENKQSLKQKLEDAKGEISELGGKEAFTTGEWLLNLVRKSFRNYYERASAEYFRQKYPTLDNDAIAKKLTRVAAANASLLGVVVGAAVSANEIAALLTGGGLGIGMPGLVAVAVAAIGAEAIMLVRMQLKLVANLAKLYRAPLDPDDPEDILTILAFAAGGSVAEAAGKFGMKVGGRLSKQAVRKYVSKEVLEALKSLGRKLGVKILQRTVIKYVVPVVSMVIGGGWNYASTRTVAKVATRHFKARAVELGNTDQPEPDA